MTQLKGNCSRLLLAAIMVSLILSAVTVGDTQAQIKYVYALDYPLAQKASYLEWVQSIAPTLQAPEELRGLISYDNYFGVSPHRYIEFEFENMGAAAKYFERPEINQVLEHVVNYGVNGGLVVLEHRGDYTAQENTGRGEIKYVFSLDYPLGQKDDYLEWVQSVAPLLQAPEEISRIASYDNYFGSSPHRYIAFEFSDLETAGRYFERPEISSVFEEIVNRGVNGSVTILKLRSDYVTE
jgi:hypothetical protein